MKRIVWPQHLVEPHHIEGYSDQAFDLLNVRINVELSAAAVFVHVPDPLDGFNNGRGVPFGCRGNGGWITDDNRRDNPAVLGHADFIEDFRGTQMRSQRDPAGSQTPGRRGEHQVGNCQSAIHIERLDLFKADDKNRAGCIIEDVEIFVSQNSLVHLDRRVGIPEDVGKKIFLAFVGEPFKAIPILDDNEPARLAIAGGRRQAAILKNFFHQG
jgi:hypothetical protein